MLIKLNSFRYSRVVRTKENLAAVDIEFSAEELEEMDKSFASVEIVGGRYYEGATHLWG